MKRLGTILVLLFILLLPNNVNAEQKNRVEVYFNIPANVIFKNEDLIIREEINCGEKLLEPSHVEVDGYIFKGWYNGDVKWNFDTDIVEDDITLMAKYIKEDSFTINTTSDENNAISASILNDIDLSNNIDDIEENDAVEVVLKVTDANDTITDTEKEKFEKITDDKNLIIGKYLDLSLIMKINGNEANSKEIHETNGKVKIELTIPEDMRFSNRKYSLLRLHNNKVEVVYEGFPTKDWKLVFETDKFSIYAIAYSEIKQNNPNVPKTLDNIMMWVITLIISILGLGSIILFKRKNKESN